MFSQFEWDSRLNPQRPEDSGDIRLASLIRSLTLEQLEDSKLVRDGDFVILGYPDDRGVSRNGGRSGAAAGPDEIRKFLYRMTPVPKKLDTAKGPRFWDLGNLRSWGMDLSEAHEAARKISETLREKKLKVISLGGGHDWAYADFVGFEGSIIHLDAHLDVRPQPLDSHIQNHSGTPFRRILDEKKQRRDLIPIGMQQHCTALTHLQYLQSFQISPVFLEEIPLDLNKAWDFLEQRFPALGKTLGQKKAFSLDLDVFSQSIAPGVSAPQAMGLSMELFKVIFDKVLPNLDHMGIYELNPAYDRDGQTARLAAKIVHNFLFQATE